MKLPKRGFFVDDANGKVLWAWEHWNADTDFDSVTPFITTMDGETHAVIPPAGTIIDLEAEDITPGDMRDLHRDLEHTRLRRRPDGSLRIVKILGQDEQGNDVEVDHPIVETINFQREKKGEPPLRKGK